MINRPFRKGREIFFLLMERASENFTGAKKTQFFLPAPEAPEASQKYQNMFYCIYLRQIHVFGTF